MLAVILEQEESVKITLMDEVTLVVEDSHVGEEDMVVVEVDLVKVEALEESEAEEDVAIIIVNIITPDLILSMDSRNQEIHGWLLLQMGRQ